MKRQAASIDDVVKSVINDIGSRAALSQEDVVSLWQNTVGKTAGGHSKPVSLKKGLLTVNVDDSGWLYELTTKKREILKKIETRFGSKKLKEIRFRIGEIK